MLLRGSASRHCHEMRCDRVRQKAFHSARGMRARLQFKGHDGRVPPGVEFAARVDSGRKNMSGPDRGGLGSLISPPPPSLSWISRLIEQGRMPGHPCRTILPHAAVFNIATPRQLQFRLLGASKVLARHRGARNWFRARISVRPVPSRGSFRGPRCGALGPCAVACTRSKGVEIGAAGLPGGCELE